MFKRKRTEITGTGKSAGQPYGKSEWLSPMLSTGFAAGATALGYGALAPAASALGGFLGQKFKDITGFGDYTVRKNTLLHGTVPSVGNPSSVPDGLTISHREYLGDVITSKTANTFSYATFTINPNNPQTWEWLAQIACNYEEWIPEGIIFYFKSTSGSALNSTNTALGTVIMATNYNPYARPFQSKAEMESYEFCTNGPPSSDLMHMIECDPHHGAISTYFISNVNTSSNSSTSQDLRFTTLGTFQLATTGFQGTSVNIGELWVTYQVTLIKPKLYESLGYAMDAIDITGNGFVASQLINFTGATVNCATIPFQVTTAWDYLYFFPTTKNLDIHWPLYGYPIQYVIIYTLTMTPTSEKGEAGAESQKRKWGGILEDAREGKWRKLEEEHPREYLQSYSNLHKIRMDRLQEELKDLDGELQGVWYHGESGAGKSSRARRENPGMYWKDVDHDAEKWWDCYEGQKTILIEDLSPFNRKMTDGLKKWSDRYVFLAQYKGGYMKCRPEKIVVTSQYTIDEIWEDEKTRAAMHRRFTEVYVDAHEEREIREREKEIRESMESVDIEEEL